jgi:hypothetical protein
MSSIAVRKPVWLKEAVVDSDIKAAAGFGFEEAVESLGLHGIVVDWLLCFRMFSRPEPPFPLQKTGGEDEDVWEEVPLGDGQRSGR